MSEQRKKKKLTRCVPFSGFKSIDAELLEKLMAAVTPEEPRKRPFLAQMHTPSVLFFLFSSSLLSFSFCSHSHLFATLVRLLTKHFLSEGTPSGERLALVDHESFSPEFAAHMVEVRYFGVQE